MVIEMETKLLDGAVFLKLVSGATSELASRADEINALNVFPIPDGDTGENMYLTLSGGFAALSGSPSDSLSEASARLASGMLMSARGNSGVILSQLFAGIAAGFDGLDEASPADAAAAVRQGVQRAFTAVAKPVEGTILTVARDALEFAEKRINADSTLEELGNDFYVGMSESLERTPELLPALKQAGVVDSGGAGLLAILDGAMKALRGEAITPSMPEKAVQKTGGALNFELFGSDDVMIYGYCTECLLRLQSAKTDVDAFSIETIRPRLEELGDSMVLLRDGSVVKLHIHTLTPEKVLALMHEYGEFLTVKIENMTLQHHETLSKKPEEAEAPAPAKKERTKFATVAVASGEGIKKAFVELGADEIIDGGQSNNPSAEDFIKAFDAAAADNIFVLPNNSNIILAAKQAAELYTDSKVLVVGTRNIGEGYAVMSVLSYDSDDPEIIRDELEDAMQGVKTGTVSEAVRDTYMDGIEVHSGERVGFMGKRILSCEKDIPASAASLLRKMSPEENEFLIIIWGKNVSTEDRQAFMEAAADDLSGLDVCEIDGGMDVYDMYLILQ